MDWLKEQAEHFRRIREDPHYRFCEMMADIEAERAPAWGGYEPAIPPREDALPCDTPAAPSNYQDQLDHIRATVTYLQNKVNEHIDKSKNKAKGKY